MTAYQTQPRNSLLTWAAAAVIVAVAAWSYYPTGRGLVRVWQLDPNYSQGFLIPLFAAGLLGWRIWEARPRTEPSVGWGVGLLGAAVVLRGAGAYLFVTPLDHASLLVALVGLCFLFGGRSWFARAWPALALLVFMFPLPGSLGTGVLTEVLQSVATRSSTFLLQTLGIIAAREGNVILLKGAELGVVEACSGLRMLMVFCALASVTATVLPIGWGRKVLLVASAVPLAIVCNVARITVAGVASSSLGTETGYFIFHDLAGCLMVPVAFLLLGCEIYLLSKLFRPVLVGPVAAPVGAKV